MGSFNGVDTVGGHRMTIGGPSNYLPMNPYQIMRAGGGRTNLKMMAGVTKHDGSFAFASKCTMASFTANYIISIA